MSTYCRRTLDLVDDSASSALPTVVDSADAALAVISALRCIARRSPR